MNKITALVAVDYTTPNAKQDFVRSLRETGFGVLKNHPLNQSQVQAIYEQWRIFFSEERKNDFKVPDNGSGGFYPQSMSETAKGNTIKDLKEFFHFYSGDVCPDDLRPAVQAYYESAMTLAAELLQWIEDESPPEISFLYSQRLSDMIEGSRKHVLRILHYPPLSGDEEPAAIRAAGHEDINLITLLMTATAAGLQVMDHDGSWIDVNGNHEQIIVDSGDMIQNLTNGLFKSTTHRVVNPGDPTQRRFSMPMFVHPRNEIDLTPREEFVSRTGGVSSYQSITAGEYLHQRLVEIGLASK